MSNKQLYDYYLTIPPTINWRIIDKYIPNQYKMFFNGDKHFSFEEFQKKLRENYEFRLFVEERWFQKIIEEYIKRNAYISCYNKGNSYTGGHCITEICWKFETKPFIKRESWFSINQIKKF